MKTRIRILAAACSMLAAGTAAAQSAGGFIDASNRAIDVSVGGMAIGGSYEQVLAQTLTVEIGGNIDGVYLPVGCSDGALYLEVRDVVAGEPGPTVLDSQLVPAHLLPLTQRFKFIAFKGGAKVRAGDEIALVLSNPKGECGIARSRLSSDYAGGHAFFDSRPNPPGTWIPNGSFPNEPDDYPFALGLY